jgi:GNAT superfamily N-acetyltransferase
MGVDSEPIRQLRQPDAAAVVGVWYRSGRAAYASLPSWQSFTLDMARKVFREVIQPTCDIWVGVRGIEIVAYLAMRGTYIDRMYVDPEHQGQGWGSRLLGFAKGRCPGGLELHTHQENGRARQFCEKHGFMAVKFGVSPPPENAPDVEYHWRPANARLQPPAGILK